jgi:hypothetical protein
MRKASAPSTTTVAITNQLRVPLDVYDQFDPSTAGHTQPLLYTRLATVAPGATANVTTIRTVSLLIGAITGPIAELNGNHYLQFPVKAMSGTQVTFGNPPPLAYTITEADRATAILSFNFHKFAMANPSSALTKNFNDALKTGFSAVDAFFKATANFQACTMASWHIIVTWLDSIFSGWQGPYFLYEAPPSTTAADSPPRLIATLGIEVETNTAVVTLCSSDESGTPVFSAPLQQTTLEIVTDGTMREVNAGTDMPVSLTPMWMNVIQTPIVDGKPTPKYLIGSAVTGTVGGTQVISSQTARQLPGKPATKSASEQSSFDKMLAKAAEIIGALAGLVAIYEFSKKLFAKGENQKEANKRDASDEGDLETKNGSADEQIRQELTDPESGLPTIEATTLLNAETVARGYADTVTQMQTDTMTDVIEQKVADVEQQVTEDLENGITPTEEFEEAFSDVQSAASSALEKIQEGDFESWSADFNDRLSRLSTESATASAEVADSVAELQRSYEEGSRATEALDAAAEEYETESQNEETDSNYDPEDVNEPPEVDEVPAVEI